MKFYYTSFYDHSIKGFDTFVNTVLKAKDFKLSDIPDKFSLQKEMRKLDNLNGTHSPFGYSGVWYEGKISIPLPAEGQNKPEKQAPRLTIEGVHHRKLAEVIKSAFEGPDSLNYHYTPVKTFWQATPNDKEQRVYGEVYQSDAFWEEHEAIMKSLPETQMDMPVTVAAIMLYSDSTHLANFGSASLWPCYLYFGNQSKYERGKPSAYAAHHLIYIPTVSVSLVVYGVSDGKYIAPKRLSGPIPRSLSRTARKFDDHHIPEARTHPGGLEAYAFGQRIQGGI